MSPADLVTNAFTDEARRLAALDALALLDTEPEREFDALVAVAAEMLGCPIALLSFIDGNRIWIKAADGCERGEIFRDIGMCNVTIRGEGPLVIDDLALDPRFDENPLVRAAEGARFYAGAPVFAIDDRGDRQPVGSLCVIDTAPRTLDAAGQRALAHLATLTEAMIAARAAAHTAIEIATTADRQAATLARQDRIFRQAERMAAMGSWRVSLDGDDTLQWSDGVYHIHGLPVGDQPSMSVAMAFYPPHARDQITAGLNTTIETGTPFDLEVDFETAQGEARRVRVFGESETVDGKVIALVGVFQDVTERHALETTLRRSADTDSLTGIANRAAFDRMLDAAMTRSHADRTPLLLALVDLDGFKAINDTLGHTAGDDVLRGVGRVLQLPWLRGSFAARLGGDEFGIIIEDTDLTANPRHIRERLEDALRFPIALNGLAMVSAGTVGITALEPDCHSIRDFFHLADTVLYKAKRTRVGERRRSATRNAA
ncbi:sensor domain-containing diguanylate cyclase [Sphingomonas faeni]|uniref:sensor domain-containing diguanylate cyclase n=1 Tax=Sphingomonas faeni TaxID=185950 RepID=UPI00334B61A9